MYSPSGSVHPGGVSDNQFPSGQASLLKPDWASQIAGILQTSACPANPGNPDVPSPDAGNDPVLKPECRRIEGPDSRSDLLGQGWFRAASLELPKAKKKLYDDMVEHERKTQASHHVFTLARDGVAHVPDDSPLRKHMQVGHVLNEHTGWCAVCLKCGVMVELKRWRQYSQWACRKAAKPKLAGGEREEPKMTSWAALEASVEFLEEHARKGEVVQAKQRKVLSRLMIVTNVLMSRGTVPVERQACDHAAQGQSSASTHLLGQGGQSLKLASLNIGSLHGRIDAVHELGHLIALQETMVSTRHVRSVQGEAKAYSLTYATGTVAMQKRDSVGRLQSVKGQGMGVLHDANVTWQGLKKHYSRGQTPSRRLHSGWVISMGVA